MSDLPDVRVSSQDFLAPIFTPPRLLAAVDGTAWLRALLAAEAALARAEAAHGLVPAHLAAVITECARDIRATPEQVALLGKGVGNPAAGVVIALTEHVAASSDEAAKYVHLGATSQDIMDTAAMLVAQETLGVITDELASLAARIAVLTREHAASLMAGRTLLQQALPITFGLKAAGWLTSLVEAAEELERVRSTQLAAQLGGAVGTLASLGDRGLDIAASFASELGLQSADVPWHTDRTRLVRIGNALALVAGTVGKIATDILLLAQPEIAEVAEGLEPGAGGSSTMPHKRNPIRAVVAKAAAQRVPPLVMTLQLAMFQEHERAAGSWHSEWQTLSDLLVASGGAVHALLDAVENLHVDVVAMRAGLDVSRGQLMAEAVTTRLTAVLGRMQAHHLMQRLSRRTAARGTWLRDELLADKTIAGALDEQEIDEVLDPATYLGSTAALIARALERYENHRSGRELASGS
ncbi:3-carboxy-cis,cis-muconate cycloisomerase [Saccharopolyspora sp. ASAGF58]|uniref:3-carboxy-cis,cis-muconate cycloisomerase n=1 Tax=Saccharopolyspora sp. ASAGF58 TaxID=2719023 RepID=UPI00143FFDD2|nr:3-carboxy-cis,cis-muconate cycloisomerase [Saccharopolyspora sp. ASAGF58]QIZ37275.1 3-carboxy-cis,cis-muconate cycloisomerase [Saccharopolyspora sp. ASAGF58]